VATWGYPKGFFQFGRKLPEGDWLNFPAGNPTETLRLPAPGRPIPSCRV